jgi:hypothetical protein
MWDALSRLDISLLPDSADRLIAYRNLFEDVRQIQAKKEQLQALHDQAIPFWEGRFHRILGWAFMDVPYTKEELISQRAREINEEKHIPLDTALELANREYTVSQRIRGLCKEQGLSIQTAWRIAVGELDEFIQATDAKIQRLDIQEKEKIAFIASQEGNIRTFADALIAAPPRAPDPAPKLMGVVCFHQGGDLIDSKGEFLVADMMGMAPEQIAAIRPLIRQEEVAALLTATPADGTVVHARLEGEHLIADPEGPILLYKENAAAVILSKDQVDFGSRQRLILNPDGKMIRGFAAHDSRTDRRRTAAVDRAESILFTQALASKCLRGEGLLFNPTTKVLAHLDAIDTNDQARKYRTIDPHYQAARAWIQRLRPTLVKAAIERSTQLASRELSMRYSYSWSKDCNRVKILQELRDKVLVSILERARAFVEKAKSDPFIRTHLDGLIRQVQDIANDATALIAELERRLPTLGSQEPADIAAIHVDLEKHGEEINRQIQKIVGALEILQAHALECLSTVQSPAILAQIEDVVRSATHSFSLFSFTCGSASAEAQREEAERRFKAIISSLNDAIIKAQAQSASVTELLMQELYKGTPLSPALLGALENFEEQKSRAYRRESERLQAVFRQQGQGIAAARERLRVPV